MKITPFRLDGELALITGGGSGLGLGMARCMVAAGARVVLVGRDELKLATAAAELGEQAAFIRHDVDELAAVPEMAAVVRERFGTVTILVNNAGNHVKKPAVEMSDEEFNSVISTHVLGAHALTRAFAPEMLKRKRGSILFTASMSSYLGIPLVVGYAAAKSAYLGMVRTLAAEFSPHGVRVNGIAPGWIESEMTRKALGSDPERAAKIMGRTPMARMGEADDIGWAAVYLCSREAQFITGTILPVDGGASIGF